MFVGCASCISFDEDPAIPHHLKALGFGFAVHLAIQVSQIFLYIRYVITTRVLTYVDEKFRDFRLLIIIFTNVLLNKLLGASHNSLNPTLNSVYCTSIKIILFFRVDWVWKTTNWFEPKVSYVKIDSCVACQISNIYIEPFLKYCDHKELFRDGRTVEQ